MSAVTVHLFKVPRSGLPAATLRMSLDRGPLRRTPGLRFSKLVGTGDGRTFTIRDADPTRWGLLAVWESPADLHRFESTSTTARSWNRLATERWRVDLLPVRSRGQWAGQEPFAGTAVGDNGQPAAAITRARIRWRHAARFWHSVPPGLGGAAPAAGTALRRRVRRGARRAAGHVQPLGIAACAGGVRVRRQRPPGRHRRHRAAGLVLGGTVRPVRRRGLLRDRRRARSARCIDSPAMRDVVVVGAGHNALVAACYLARSGLEVEVVERRDVVGGAVSTTERFPGYLMDVGSSAHIMVRHTGIIEDLGLEGFGLEYQDLDPWGFAPFGDDALVFSVDLDASCASIEKLCGARDAHAYRAFAEQWGSRNEKVFDAFQEAPTAANLGRRLWSLGRSSGVDGVELSRQFLRSGDALLDELFTDERLKTALAWLGAQSGPPTHEVATADLVGWNAMLHHRAPGHPVGGSGMLSVALARCLESLGGTIRLGDGCARIATRSGRILGVETDSGDRIGAPRVLAGCHVLTTFELVGWDQLPAAFADRARRAIRVGNGIGMVVRLATNDLPHYPGAVGGREWRALQLLAPSRAHLRRAHADFVARRPPEQPAVLAMTFSAFDDTIAPPGKHNVTLWGQWHAYELDNGERWDDIGEREGEKLVAAVDAVAPGFAGSVERMHVQTPLDLERELGLRRGNVMHVEMGLDQMFAWRPLPELAGYRTPVEGLYLTGASTHPGGGVFGASGRSAANAMLRDTAPRWRRWR